MIPIILMPQWLGLIFISLPPLGIVAVTLIICYISFEIFFFFYYHWHLIPSANARISYDKPPAPYRDYIDIKDREKLLIRILDRLDERMSNVNTDQQEKSDVYYRFIESWFQKKNEDGETAIFHTFLHIIST